MNEPVLTEDKKGREWTPGAFGDRYFVQRLTLDFAGRTREEIAKAWVDPKFREWLLRDATAAIAQFNGQEYDGRNMVVNEARPRTGGTP